jgi:hypothetical protein
LKNAVAGFDFGGLSACDSRSVSVLHLEQWKTILVTPWGVVSLASGIIGRPQLGQFGIGEIAGVLMSSPSTVLSI